MIDNEKLNKIIKDCETAGHNIRIRDIAYVLLCECFEDSAISYKVIFGDKLDNNIYHNSPPIKFLRHCIEQEKKRDKDDITFEENKKYMLKLKADTEKAMNNGEIEKKDALKILSDISVKLNDKFQVHNETKEQMVIVNTKYNNICEYCHHEIYIPTKEELIKEYNLTNNNKNAEESLYNID